MEIDHGLFDGIFDIVASDFEPKPDPAPFGLFIERFDVNPARSVMFEDLPRNLEPAKMAGMLTVLVTPQTESDHKGEAWERADAHHEHIDHRTDDLTKFIDDVAILLGK